MKRSAVLIFTLLIILGIGPVAAQDSISQAEADYRFQFDLYRTAYQQYQIDKAEYRQTGTLRSESEALDSAKLASVARAEVLKTYTTWLRMRLLAFETVYPRTAELATRLEVLNNWYQEHAAKVEAATSTEAFELVQKEYTDGLVAREELYLQSQIELKLGELTSYRLDLEQLFEDLRPKLEAQSSNLEIEQGISRTVANFETLDEQIASLSEDATQLEPTESSASRRSSRDAVRRAAIHELESMRELLLRTITLLSELEVRYGS
jgi:hypothetical protein